MFLKNVFSGLTGVGQFVIFPGLFYIQSKGKVLEEMVSIVKKQLKKAGRVRQTHAKRSSDGPKQQYYSFGIFVGDY